MYQYLTKIQKPKDVKQLNDEQLSILAEEIRDFLIQTVSKTGGHLASNLGVVELTLALFQTFDLPNDKVVWDVGHQTYVHKLLTGRQDAFETLRTFRGLSGFPKSSESEYDFFNTGHSSTSISAALGMARARNIRGKNNHVVAVIGDGALTGGMAYEALNDAGFDKKNFIVVLNDNGMSISQNVGSITHYLTRLRSKPLYFKFKADLERVFRRIPAVGMPTVMALKKIKDNIRHLLTPSTLFEDLGFTYLGPIDGHDIKTLNLVLENAKRINGPVLLHVLTKKGKGYKFAEDKPSIFHGIGKFHVETGKCDVTKGNCDYSSVVGNALTGLAKTDECICAITAAMPTGTGLGDFASTYPDRFFDVAIAEQHAVTFAAGLAKSGFKPYVAVYSSFLQRAYDQILHDCALQNLPVVFCVDRAGLVGEDGETHQGIFDISFLTAMPNMTLLAPANFDDLRQMISYANTVSEGVVAIRYPRGNQQAIYPNATDFRLGQADTVFEGSDVCILCVGSMLKIGCDTHDLLQQKSISATVLNMRTILPLNTECMSNMANNHKLIVTIEDGVVRGGFGEMVSSFLHKKDITAPLLIKGHENPIVPQGKTSELYELCGLDAQAITNEIIEKLERISHE